MPELFRADLDDVVGRVGVRWEQLRDAHILLTGGTGFIGMWLLETFLRAECALRLRARVTVLTRSPESFQAKAPHLGQAPSIRLYRGDVVSPEIQDASFTHIIHAAADARRSAAPGDAFLQFDTIAGGTRQILSTCLTAQTKALLYISSGAVYGRMPATDCEFHEGYSGAPATDDPQSAYGQAKRAAEFFCTVTGERTSTPVKIARCFTFLGPHLPLDGSFAAGNFMADALRQCPIRVSGDGSTVRSYLYAADLAAWLWSILLDSRAHGIYNVGSDQPVTIRDLAGAVASAVHPALRVECARLRTSTVSRYVPSIEKARRELGLDVWTPLPDALSRTLKWFRETASDRPSALELE